MTPVPVGLNPQTSDTMSTHSPDDAVKITVATETSYVVLVMLLWENTVSVEISSDDAEDAVVWQVKSPKQNPFLNVGFPVCV